MDEDTKSKIRTINEGLCQIQFPEYEKVSSEAPVFYNPKMELNRDISILVIQRFQKDLNSEINIGDVFGGSGIRGIRYKKEIDNVGSVAVNDISPLAGEFTKENAIKNSISIEENNFEIHQDEANNFLRKNRGRFDVVDIDPFGTPSFFIDSVAASIKRNSLLCVTATDTSALCGTYKAPCIRKYNAKPYKSEYCHENGIRILAGFIALTFAKYKKYIEIKLSHSTEHYMRIYMIIKKGSKATDESLKNVINPFKIILTGGTIAFGLFVFIFYLIKYINSYKSYVDGDAFGYDFDSDSMVIFVLGFFLAIMGVNNLVKYFKDRFSYVSYSAALSGILLVSMIYDIARLIRMYVKGKDPTLYWIWFVIGLLSLGGALTFFIISFIKRKKEKQLGSNI